MAESTGEIVQPRSWALHRLPRQNAPSLLTGGFPCQPFSTSGQRRGTADDRYQWPAMFAVIQHLRPNWVIAENVPRLVTWQHGVVLEHICTDLESAGYDVQPLLIPACAVNAPHRCERLWLLACQTAADATRLGRQERQNPLRPARQRAEPHNPQRRRQRLVERGWDPDWQAVAAELCGVDDGLPVELDGHCFSAARSRAEQIKAYGNAIVPQVPVKILQAIKQSGFMPPKVGRDPPA
ncbi:MAG: DNA cytosine methyltransferase [Ktedonobacteraceae bacterium]|nr:DNA cytosine methyltransferase [Ktedonobacteraceae bacterium]